MPPLHCKSATTITDHALLPWIQIQMLSLQLCLPPSLHGGTSNDLTSPVDSIRWWRRCICYDSNCFSFLFSHHMFLFVLSFFLQEINHSSSSQVSFRWETQKLLQIISYYDLHSSISQIVFLFFTQSVLVPTFSSVPIPYPCRYHIFFPFPLLL